jgi:hypothetical protein
MVSLKGEMLECVLSSKYPNLSVIVNWMFPLPPSLSRIIAGEGRGSRAHGAARMEAAKIFFTAGPP